MYRRVCVYMYVCMYIHIYIYIHMCLLFTPSTILISAPGDEGEIQVLVCNIV